MKNRCIITRTTDNLRTIFICLSENDSVVASKTTHEIRLFSMHGDDSFTLRVFTTAENEIKDRLYDKLCYFLQYGKVSIINEQGESVTINTFDVEQQIENIKKSLDKGIASLVE